MGPASSRCTENCLDERGMHINSPSREEFLYPEVFERGQVRCPVTCGYWSSISLTQSDTAGGLRRIRATSEQVIRRDRGRRMSSQTGKAGAIPDTVTAPAPDWWAVHFPDALAPRCLVFEAQLTGCLEL